MATVPALDSLQHFHPATRDWFRSAFAASTPVQDEAWASIAAGRHTLVVAPTGSGKTLAAFLHAIDQVFAERDGEARRDPSAKHVARTRVLYLSPIKALGSDVQRNLQVPLQGISARRSERGDPTVALSVAMRTGDTSSSERARLLRRAPDILITTPESLYLMLTSQARDILRDVHTVILDEIHAVAGSKRGSHLALSLERLDALLQAPAQRIGLSATVRPVEGVAAFLGGDRAVQVVQPASQRQLELKIVVPIEDMTDLAVHGPAEGHSSGARTGSIWPHVEASILDNVLQHRSTIVFANSRGVAERLTARLNELHAERSTGEHPELTAGETATAYGSFTGSTVNRVTAPGTLIARSHHGSVSKEQRAAIEQALKSGELRCVVATSSLELGIDMGLVDLVIQVAAPHSVSSALQRVGRAGHQVGGLSRGLLYPRTRRDLVDAAVVVDSMLDGRIEAIDSPRNPLDVLAQQTVAAVAMEPLDVEAWYARVRRAAPYRTLPRNAFDAVLDMLAGRYPSDAFAGFRPRLVWDRKTGTLTARPGARQLAVTSGGTIPDRGMYAVVLPEGEEQAGSRRVGELDEEMVHESRVNDVITLGATSWRIDQITLDQVVVTPAPGRSARLPFWRGEGIGRPAELGQATGAFLAELEADPGSAGEPSPALLARLRGRGLDDNAIGNMLALVAEQQQATGVLPTDRRLVVERCRDELGDWRVMLHSPYGRRVHDPWALAVAARLREQAGVDAAVVASDDGIIVRMPDRSGVVPGAEIFLFDAASLRHTIHLSVTGSALFAARFRECASRALLLPRRTPGKRSPLWQQRLRAGQLLEITRGQEEFPILVETARECLQDVYDLDALDALMLRMQAGQVGMVEVETAVPSPFAANLLFGYVAEFMYEADVPLAERRASVLALDSGLLAELLGQVDLGELLDDDVVATVARELQRLDPIRHARGSEGVADLLRELGPLPAIDVAQRITEPAQGAAWLEALHAAGRAIRVAVAGTEQWAAVEDAARLRDALGIDPPADVAEAFLAPVPDPLGDLLSRHARHHGPFSSGGVAARFGLGVAVVDDALHALQEQGRIVRGRFGLDRRQAMDELTPASPRAAHEWVAADVLQRLRLRSLQAAREATRPVPVEAYVDLLLQNQGVLHEVVPAPDSESVLQVIEQLAGLPLPASLWEQQVLPARVPGYRPALLDELLATGAVLWAGHGRVGDDDGLVSLHVREHAPETLPTINGEMADSPMQQAILHVLADGGAFFAPQLAMQVQLRLAETDRAGEDFPTALWQLAWRGQVSSDLWAPLRALGGARPARARPVPVSRRRRGFAFAPATSAAGAGLELASSTGPTLAGRWSLLPQARANDTVRALAQAEALLDRYTVVTRSAAMSEAVAGGFPALRPVLRSMEDSGRLLRGRFVEGMGGAQFAQRDDIDRLRVSAERPGRPGRWIALSALDPANPFGSLLPWPLPSAGPKPVRRAGAMVVIGAGRLQLYLPQGGRQLTSWIDATAEDAAARWSAAAQALAVCLRRGRRMSFTLERINEEQIHRGPAVEALREAGFSSEPRGLGWNG
ncbi:ATP-dependent helicase [Stenotrophomonas sp. ESTM1D_MKCIP4_1]|uniref:ATP-dependent helicase n=1 Tax=Stenotrophomonas sp. ESTM1D_MKCIP4_1 TaxID=2072414 RepID=UPI000D53D3AD|nr:ATP-dependent helicase [Stenotrophomonas sp. ESTM1D_MKCIP4_1]AWH53060.1 ATP-dependent helicase [Stenotrophomonas sp. ESTM1D_MKCIP4_1]